MDALSSYHSDESDVEPESSTLHLKSDVSIEAMKSAMAIDSAPTVESKREIIKVLPVDASSKEVMHNPKYEELAAPKVGPDNPFLTKLQSATKNTLSGYVEAAHMNDFIFESQRRTFSSYGYAIDPSFENQHGNYVGDVEKAKENDGQTVFEKGKMKPEKRKREAWGESSDVDNFKGPWAPFEDELKIAMPSEEEQALLDAQFQKTKAPKLEEKPEEKSTLHIKDTHDYLGRSFLHPPQDVGVNLGSEDPPEKCYMPKKEIHRWTGHTKGVAAIRLFPKSGHLLLSCGMDSKVKLWEVYHKRRCIQTYQGHRNAVRDACFSNDGKQFLTASYDKFVKLWDTETGECINRFTSRKVPYCVKFNPDEDKQNLFIVGQSDKKMLTWDTRSGEIVQEYDRHLGPVNTITFIDQNRRIVTTSDDKSIRVWEWDIPVDSKYIADPSMHSMPSVTLSPNEKWLACQSMDNKVYIYNAISKMREHRRKTFKGHMVAGYACQVNFSPDSMYLISGDGNGFLCIWDFKTTRMFSKFRAHENVCVGCEWLPHETSKVVTCGWDGLIKLWD
ncbi:pre-mRNA-processing factor 17-like [Oscarella lobularis]|uniref:pre-mRNA-processing factor 17-like n=1 Tax=Oscarella lobularis TaxID=121494 RepID=UPI0033137285